MGQLNKVMGELPSQGSCLMGQKKDFLCLVPGHPDVARAVTACMAMGGPLLETNWFTLDGVTVPIGGANISMLRLPDLEEETPYSYQMIQMLQSMMVKLCLRQLHRAPRLTLPANQILASCGCSLAAHGYMKSHSAS